MEELRTILIASGEEVTKELIDEMFKIIDKDGGGHISYKEFIDAT